MAVKVGAEVMVVVIMGIMLIRVSGISTKTVTSLKAEVPSGKVAVQW